mgnify:CR=1 FL=1
MEKSDIITVNATFKCEAQFVQGVERHIESICDLISFKFLPDTTELYATDKNFQKLVDNKKKADAEHRTYLNKLDKEY